ncbi:hypothetical protein T492DRAFT_1152655 [Pavlovales sp. CCMP2436]|nr:hypothetical protein T492DRAFT_1152655 [Pavlovales sp. CCMP2436]
MRNRASTQTEQTHTRAVGSMGYAMAMADTRYPYVSGGSTYDGEWQNGLQHGWGRIRGADGTVHEGLWVSGVIDDSRPSKTERLLPVLLTSLPIFHLPILRTPPRRPIFQ